MEKGAVGLLSPQPPQQSQRDILRQKRDRFRVLRGQNGARLVCWLPSGSSGSSKEQRAQKKLRTCRQSRSRPESRAPDRGPQAASPEDQRDGWQGGSRSFRQESRSPR